MSYVGRAAVWAPAVVANEITVGVVRDEPNQAQANQSPTGSRLTPLNRMTGARIAASPNGVVRWVGGEAWGELLHAQSKGPRLAEQWRRPARQFFAAFARQETRVCPRCGQAPHDDWGQEYERLVCQEITAA